MSNDPWFRAGQRTGRKIEDEKLPPPQPGIIADAPDTFRGTASVKIGAKVVTAHYFGSAPTVGEPVIVQQSGNDFLIIHQVPSASGIGGTAGAPTLPTPAGTGRPPIPAFTIWGHSYTHSPPMAIGGMSVTDAVTHPWYPGGSINPMLPWRPDRLLASMLGLPEDKVRHFGVGGAQLLVDQQGQYPLPAYGVPMPNTKRYGWAWILQMTSRGMLNRFGWLPQHGVPSGIPPLGTPSYTHTDGQFGPFMPFGGAHFLLYGANDLGRFGDPTATVDVVPNMMGIAWTEVNFSVISRLRCGGVIEDDLIYDSAKQAYGISYSGPWTRVASTAYNSGTGLTGLAQGTNGSFTVHLGADWPGGVLTLRFRGEPGNGGAFATTGVPSTSLAKRMPATFTSVTQFNDVANLENTSTATKTIPPWAPSYSTVARRVPVARTGSAQTLVVLCDATAGQLWFDCCDLEQTGMAAPVIVANIPRPARWLSAYATSPRWAAYPDSCTNADNSVHSSGVAGADNTGAARGTQVTEDGDTWAATMNTRLTAVATSFAETAPDGTALNTVQVADFYTVCDGVKHPEFYLPEDILHPNAAGCAAMAGEFYRAAGAATAHAQSAAVMGAA